MCITVTSSAVPGVMLGIGIWLIAKSKRFQALAKTALEQGGGTPAAIAKAADLTRSANLRLGFGIALTVLGGSGLLTSVPGGLVADGVLCTSCCVGSSAAANS